MNISGFPRTERAQMAMMLEVCAGVKPGNIDRGHDYEDTWLEHFLASTIFSRKTLEKAEKGLSSLGSLIQQVTRETGRHRGGNTHFGAFLLLLPLVMGGDIPGACRIIQATTIDDAVAFYDAFSHTAVRVHETDELDINDPDVADKLRERGMTFYDVMAYSADYDMVAREWVNGFALSRMAADLLKADSRGRAAIPAVFLLLLGKEPDTFIAKKFGLQRACEIRDQAAQVIAGKRDLEEFDVYCIREGINPGSLADIMIAGIYIAMDEGWDWDQ
ncbi:MAG TPA: triphosphoribosyl-dephospho-CoA synthase [Methanospirillum sp.]|nr:triphosphoribosyl-dephospho-CoA synthase [Methanospirillum sp.]